MEGLDPFARLARDHRRRGHGALVSDPDTRTRHHPHPSGHRGRFPQHSALPPYRVPHPYPTPMPSQKTPFRPEAAHLQPQWRNPLLHPSSHFVRNETNYVFTSSATTTRTGQQRKKTEKPKTGKPRTDL